MIPNFEITSNEIISQQFRLMGITDFESACDFVKRLPVDRNSNRTDYSLVLHEKKGSCSTKHALLARLAEENQQEEIELIFGIYLVSPETHPFFTDFFNQKSYTAFPESHCYLRYKGERCDFTSSLNFISKIESNIIREQRIEPHQVGEWKEKIHQDYLIRWLKRKTEINATFEEIWQDREKLNSLLHLTV